ncbi:hypothetical protein [Candidatus Harpocratesius sp.]
MNNSDDSQLHSTRFIAKKVIIPIYVPKDLLFSENKEKIWNKQVHGHSNSYEFHFVYSIDELQKELINNQSSIVLIYNSLSRQKIDFLLKNLQKFPIRPKLFMIVDAGPSDLVSYYLFHGITGAIEMPFNLNELDLLFHAQIKSCIYELE